MDNKKILVLDDRNYLGGRLITHYRPQYEIGGARFHDDHTLLMALVEEYRMDVSKISNQVDYLHRNQDKTTNITKMHITFDNIMNNVIQKSKMIPKKHLLSMTTQQFINKISGSNELSKKAYQYFRLFKRIHCHELFAGT